MNTACKDNDNVTSKVEWRVSRLLPTDRMAKRAGVKEKLQAYEGRLDEVVRSPEDAAWQFRATQFKKYQAAVPFFHDFVWEGASDEQSIAGKVKKFGTGLYIALELAPLAEEEDERLIGCWKIEIHRAGKHIVKSVEVPGIESLAHPFWESVLAAFVWHEEYGYETELLRDFRLKSQSVTQEEREGDLNLAPLTLAILDYRVNGMKPTEAARTALEVNYPHNVQGSKAALNLRAKYNKWEDIPTKIQGPVVRRASTNTFKYSKLILAAKRMRENATSWQPLSNREWAELRRKVESKVTDTPSREKPKRSKRGGK